MNFAICLIFVCFFNLINLNHASVEEDENSFVKNDKLIDRPFYDDSVQSGLSDKEKFNLHHAFVTDQSKWENGVVFYKIDKNFNQDEIYEIKRAMNEIESSSCIRFEAHLESYGPHYVMIKKNASDRNCGESDIGCRAIGEQVIWLSDTCIYLSNILDLLLRALGFDSHQNRSDRDKYIQIHTENIVSEEVDRQYQDFRKVINFDEKFKYLTPFDFSSIMLVSEYGASKNDKAVITPRAPGVTMQTKSTNSTLSEFDKILLNHFYECNEKKATSGAASNMGTLMKTVIKVINGFRMLSF